MTTVLRSLFGGREAAGAPELVRRFGTGDPTLSRACLAVDGDAWRIDLPGGQAVRLFELEEPGLEHCLLTYRARLRAEGLRGRAYLEMWCRLPGRGEFFSRGFHQALTGTTGWTSCEVPFWLKKGQRPDLIKLNVVIEGAGRVQIADVELLSAPLH